MFPITVSLSIYTTFPTCLHPPVRLIIAYRLSTPNLLVGKTPLFKSRHSASHKTSMGSCFSKSEPVSTSGRTAGRAPAASKPAKAAKTENIPLQKQPPKKQQNTYNSPGHTLGGTGETLDAKEAAAKAAEARAQGQGKGGKLSQQLAKEKKKTRTELMTNEKVEERLVYD